MNMSPFIRLWLKACTIAAVKATTARGNKFMDMSTMPQPNTAKIMPIFSTEE